MLIDRVHRHRNIFYPSDDSKSDYYISIILASLEPMYCNWGAIGANLTEHFFLRLVLTHSGD